MQTYADYGIYVPPAASGEFAAVCPKCSDTRKKSKTKCLSVNIEKGVWHCHHCGWSDGLKTNSSFTKPAKVCRQVTYKKADLPEKVKEWFTERGISEQVLVRHDIGYDGKWIKFPYKLGDKVVNIKYRDGAKNFRQEKDALKTVFGYNDIQDQKEIIITEGEMDKLSFDEIGASACSVPDGAPPAQTSNYSSKFDYLRSIEDIIEKAEKIILAVDSDAPGYKLREELARRIGVEKCWIMDYPEGCKDANDVLVKHGKGKLKDCLENIRPYPVEGIFKPFDFKDRLINLYENGPERGHSTGWSCLDDFYTVKPGEMTIITGIPSHGKTAWLDALMVNLARRLDWKFAVFSPESQPLERHSASLIEKYVGRCFDRRYNYHMATEEFEIGVRWLNEHFEFILPDEEATLQTILEKARVSVFRSGINGVVIDPWNELDDMLPAGLNETRYISIQLKRIRKFARKHLIHFFVVAHPTKMKRAKTDETEPVPTLYDVNGSANFRNRTDNGLCIWRDLLAENGEVQIHVQKVKFREVGRIGMANLYFDTRNGQYHEQPINYRDKPVGMADYINKRAVSAPAKHMDACDCPECVGEKPDTSFEVTTESDNHSQGNANSKPPNQCYTCRESNFWHNGGDWVCNRCHPNPMKLSNPNQVNSKTTVAELT